MNFRVRLMEGRLEDIGAEKVDVNQNGDLLFFDDEGCVFAGYSNGHWVEFWLDTSEGD